MRKLLFALFAIAVLGVTTSYTAGAGVPDTARKSVAAPMGGGSVLPAAAQPKGYSLIEARQGDGRIQRDGPFGCPAEDTVPDARLEG